jgi:lipopolysaccharide biosynthesis glycosyltransferase
MQTKIPAQHTTKFFSTNYKIKTNFNIKCKKARISEKFEKDLRFRERIFCRYFIDSYICQDFILGANL